MTRDARLFLFFFFVIYYNCPRRVLAQAKTRGGTLGLPACIHIRNFKSKKVSTVSKFIVCGKNLDLIKLGTHGRLALLASAQGGVGYLQLRGHVSSSSGSICTSVISLNSKASNSAE